MKGLSFLENTEVFFIGEKNLFACEKEKGYNRENKYYSRKGVDFDVGNRYQSTRFYFIR